METNLIWLEGRGSNCRRGYLDRLQVGWMDMGLSVVHEYNVDDYDEGGLALAATVS